MNSFEMHVKEFETEFSDYQNCGAIKFIIKTSRGVGEFLEWVRINTFSEKWCVERVDTHIETNEMFRIKRLFKLKDKTVACVRDHHYPIEEIQDCLQKWLDKNVNKNF